VRSSLTSLVSLLLVLALSSCAGFKGKRLDPVDSLPEPQNRPSVQARLELEQFVNDGPTTLFPESAEHFRRMALVRTFRKTEVFSAVGTDLNNPDITVDVRMQTRAHINYFSTFLTGLTLYLVPSQVTDEFDVRARVTNQNGQQWTITLEDHVTLWQHISLLPLMPFKTVPEAMIEVHENMYRHLVKEMLERDIIQNSEQVQLSHRVNP
jgi:hypothetical protein